MKKDNSTVAAQVRSEDGRSKMENGRSTQSSILRPLFSILLAAALPLPVLAQGNYALEGQEYNISGLLPGEQVYPQASIRPSGGYLVWQDNVTDGDGLGISARKLDSSLSSVLSPFRVNEKGANDQDRPSVSMLNDGGAVFVWQGGKTSFQHIYARFLSGAGTWSTGDVMANTPTNVYQLESTVTTLTNGNVAVVWSSFNQAGTNSLRDVYVQLFTPAGVKVGLETRANEVTAFNQRSAAVAPLSDGRFVVVWISEQQRSVFGNVVDNNNGTPSTQIGGASVDVYGRVFNANGTPAGSEFLVNSGTSVCASPSVARTSDGGFAVAWMEKDLVMAGNSWDIFVRPFSGNALGGVTRRVNTWVYGDRLGPKISAMGTDYLVVWTSMGQDGSRDGAFGQFLRGDGALLYGEFRVNSTTVSQQIQPVVASDGVAQFLTVWTSFVGGVGSFDLYAQRYFNTNAPLPAPGAPIVTVLSSNSLSVSWPPVQGLSIESYEVYADGVLTATAVTTNTYWTASGLAPAGPHSYRLAYVLADGRRSPQSGATANTTYSAGATWGGIPQEWMASYFGGDIFSWPSPYIDSDGDGASNKDEFLAGTDPTNANSVLRVRLQTTTQGLFLNWNTQVGLMYQVQSAAVANGPWTSQGGPDSRPGPLIQCM